MTTPKVPFVTAVGILVIALTVLIASLLHSVVVVVAVKADADVSVVVRGVFVVDAVSVVNVVKAMVHYRNRKIPKRCYNPNSILLRSHLR